MSTAQVRSPFPTIQLLLTKDLEWARRQWQLREDRASRLPGALGLLSANKEMLREKVLCSISLCEWVPSVSMYVHAGGHASAYGMHVHAICRGPRCWQG